MESVQGRGGGRRCFLWVLGLSFLSSLSSLLFLSLLASVGCGCVLGMHEESGVLSVGLCVLWVDLGEKIGFCSPPLVYVCVGV